MTATSVARRSVSVSSAGPGEAVAAHSDAGSDDVARAASRLFLIASMAGIPYGMPRAALLSISQSEFRGKVGLAAFMARRIGSLDTARRSAYQVACQMRCARPPKTTGR